MEAPFFQNRSWYQKPAQPRYSFSRSPSTFGVPVYPTDATREIRRTPHPAQHPLPEKKSGSKVIQIPVHFFGSDTNRRSDSALKIQKAFRGFLIRKSLRKIKEIKFQVDEIEAKLSTRDFVELIRRDERERLRVNESLMNLLFKLDGIRGFDLGIRNCRKGVTRRAIALQEKIDAILAVDSQINIAENAGIENQELPTVELVKMECAVEKGSAAETVDCKSENLENSGDYGEMLDDWREEGEDVKKMEVEGDADVIDVEVACEVKAIEESGVDKENDKSVKAEVELVKMEGAVKKGSAAETVDCKSENLENSGDYGEMLDEWREEGEGDKKLEVEGDADVIDVGVACEVKAIEESGVEKEKDKSVKAESDEQSKIDEGEGKAKKNDNKRNGELLERMMEENEKMMRLMKQLFERNETQTQMLNALTNRVELLEKAYVCDKLKNRRKKNKNNKKACIEE